MPRKRVSKPRVPRTHGGGSYTKAGYFGFIRGHLRRAFSRYPPKYQVRNAAKRTVKGKRWKYEYKCNICKKWFKDSEVEVDHIEQCGSLRDYDDLPTFVRRLFCEPEGLQVVCKKCHKSKTDEQRNANEKD